MWLTAVIRRKYYPRDERRLAARYPVPPRDMGRPPPVGLWLPVGDNAATGLVERHKPPYEVRQCVHCDTRFPALETSLVEECLERVLSCGIPLTFAAPISSHGGLS
jgi:hypothetical protein